MDIADNKKKGGWKKAVKIIGITLLAAAGVFVLSAALIIGAFLYYPQKPTASADSPDGRYTVTVKQTDGRWPFGPSDVTITAEERGFSCSGRGREELCETQIWDDGGKGNVTIEWLSEDEVCITLSGSEQDDEKLTYSMTEEFDE